MFEEIKSSGITKTTPENILLGAGTIHKGLKFTFTKTSDVDVVPGKIYYTQKSVGVTPTYEKVEAPTKSSISTYYEGAWNFEESLIGATSGGSKISIKPKFDDVEVDGATVKVKGLARKIGEVATLETNMVELTADWLKRCVVGQNGTSTIPGFDVIESKERIEDGDYIVDFGYIGKKLDGTPVIIIFDYALCTSGLEFDTKDNDNSVFNATFECYAELSSDSNKLPYHIYTPTPVVKA